MNSKVRLLTEDERSLWDNYVDESPQGTVFHKSFWLEASGRKYVIYGYFRGGELYAGICLTYITKFGINVASQPEMTPYSGVLFKEHYIKYVSKLSAEKEANQQIASYQAELAVFRVASLANSVGSLGTNTSVYTDVFIPPNTEELRTETMQDGAGSEIVLRIKSPEGPTEIVEIVKYPIISNPQPLATEANAGGWMKLKITSKYIDNKATITIEQAS